ncbi:hypothetical protein [Clostridium felsineum]|uniref:hypothetical protein n=1 Tax=Clostridium felsineum TaxID=36839 RepID=UPI0009C4D09C|nr:hypothetical protein [Clostridium felsineum]URZ15336.1 hypothetical protein CLFE_013540 [Clostridium felsineum DSM 794]
MQMLINGTDLTQYNSRLINLDIQPSSVNNSDEWLRDSLTPLNLHQQFEYKKITAEILVIGNNREDALLKVSQITNLLKFTATIQFDNMSYFYDCKLSGTPSLTKGVIVNKVVMTCDFNAICYKSEESHGFNGSIVVTNNGTMECPCDITITEPVDTPIVTIKGITEEDIRVLYLKKDIPITISGENKTITEPDLDHWISDSTGNGKWIYKYWNIAMSNSPELTARPNILPTKDFIDKSVSCYHQELLSDSTNLVYNDITNIIGSIKTGLYVNSAKSVSFQFKHDDGVNVYLNNNSVYSSANAEINTPDNPNYPTITLALQQGWNVLEFVYINHLSEGGVYALTQKSSDMVDGLNCYYARDLSYLEVANKFAEVTLWEFPKLEVGINTIALSDNNAVASIAHKPRFL